MITKEMLLEIGKKKGLTNKEHIEKDYFQDVLLFNLFSRTNKFVFKGGTALYKLYNLPRFSEDLDFSIVDGMDLKQAEDILREALANIDYFELKYAKKTRDSLLIKIACKGILTKYNSLRVDINFKNKIINGYDVKNYVPEYFDINPFSLRILKLNEIIAEKIHAIFVRKKARDLFDLFFLLRIAALDRKLVAEKLKLFGIVYDRNKLEMKINMIKDVWDSELRAFVLTELPSFDIVRDFVISRINSR